MSNEIKKCMKAMMQVVGRMMFVAAVVIAGLVVMDMLGGAGSFGIDTEDVEMMALYVSLFAVLGLNVTITTAYLSTMLSCGARRSDIIKAKYILMGIIIVVNLAVNVLINIINGQKLYLDIMYLADGMITVTIVTIICGFLISKYGAKGYVIFCLVCGFVGGFVGAMIGITFSPTTNKVFSFFMRKEVPAVIFVVLLVVAYQVYVLDRKTLYTYEIR